MYFSIVVPVALIALLPFVHAILILETGTATATSNTIGITLGSTSGAAAAATLGAAALVVGALLIGCVVFAGNGNHFERDLSNYCLSATNADLFLDLDASVDEAGRGLRLVCELEATPEEALSLDELLILNLFGRHVQPATFSQMKHDKASFQYAALVSERMEGVAGCALVFDQCPYDRVTIMGAFNATK